MLSDYGGDRDRRGCKDLKKAAAFYEETLGVEAHHAEGEELVVYRSGNATV